MTVLPLRALRPLWASTWPLAVLLVGLTGSGCAPTCEQTCRKLVTCDASPRLSVQECELSCFETESLYEVWEDEAKQEALDDQAWCVRGATCDELAEGVCYDETLYQYDTSAE